LKTTFVGHPAIEEFGETNRLPSKTEDSEEFIEEVLGAENRSVSDLYRNSNGGAMYKLPEERQFQKKFTADTEEVLLLMPGSRVQEIKSLLPVFIEAAKKIKAKRIIVPTLKHLEDFIRTTIKSEKINIISDESEKIKLYKSAKLAIVASGTATLQLALSECPMVVCYKLSKISYRIVKLLVEVKYISLVNIILNKEVVPELIQDNCNSETILHTINNLCYKEQLKNFKELKAKLKPHEGTPSKKIAKEIIDFLQKFDTFH
jgi:lipid-A-disaccharide synthase